MITIEPGQKWNLVADDTDACLTFGDVRRMRDVAKARIEQAEKEAANLRRMLAVVIEHFGGEIRIPAHELVWLPEDTEITTWSEQPAITVLSTKAARQPKEQP